MGRPFGCHANLLLKPTTRILITYCLNPLKCLLLHVQVRGGQLWGTDIYTDDSDLVAGK